MKKFSKTAKTFLRDAEEDLKRGRYASCVVHAHLVIEH
jgi:HEPN domain-containing protein